MEEFHKYYEVVFLDQSGLLNLTSKLSKSTYLRVKHEAKLSLKLLNNKTISDCFQLLFIHDYSIQDCFDHFISGKFVDVLCNTCNAPRSYINKIQASSIIIFEMSRFNNTTVSNFILFKSNIIIISYRN